MTVTAPRSRTLSFKLIPRLIAGFAWITIPSFDAEAARIHTKALSQAERHDDALWANYLADGTHEWLTHAHPPVTPSLEAAVWRSLSNGTEAENPMVQFLLWRQSLDPERFDFYHPRLAKAFAKLKTPTVISPTTTPSVGTSTATTSSPTTVTSEATPNIVPEAQLIPPVPEPATLWVAMGMLTWAGWQTRKARRS